MLGTSREASRQRRCRLFGIIDSATIDSYLFLNRRRFSSSRCRSVTVARELIKSRKLDSASSRAINICMERPCPSGVADFISDVTNASPEIAARQFSAYHSTPVRWGKVACSRNRSGASKYEDSLISNSGMGSTKCY